MRSLRQLMLVAYPSLAILQYLLFMFEVVLGSAPPHFSSLDMPSAVLEIKAVITL